MFNVTGQKWTSSQTLDQRANLTPDLTSKNIYFSV